ncbi:MAG: type IV secretory system conjugative DNA transfer family protein, partial [Acidobacteriota bacterium]
LIRSDFWPSPDAKTLEGRLAIGRLYDDGRPTAFFVAPEIAKLQQTLVVAPTGSGKTTSLAVPWSRELPDKGQSVFVLDFKGDMAGQIRHPAARPGSPPVWIFDPLGEESVRWNPMREPAPGSADFAESQDAIAEAIFGEVNGGAYQYFDLLDLRILKAGVRAVANLEAPSLKALHDLFLSEQHLEEALDRIKDGPDPEAFARIQADLGATTDSRKYSFTERIQGVRNKLDAFAHPAIGRVTATDADFRLARLLEQPSCLIFTAPMRMGLAGETLAAMAVRLIQHQLHRRYGHRGGRLFLILDEFSKLTMDHKQAERFISVSRSAGAVTVIVLQDIDQLHHTTRASIWGNCQDRYILRGAGASTAKWLSESLGERRVWTRSVSATSSRGQRHQSQGGGLSAQESFVPVLRPREIALAGGLERGAWLQLSRYSPKPILVDLTRPIFS